MRYVDCMATGTLVPITQYLTTSYHPDREYVDGEVLERNVGEKDHSLLQTELALYLGSLRKALGIWVLVEQRLQVSADRCRIPDVCVGSGVLPDEQVFTQPPFLCVEILSKDDRMSEMQERIDDYLRFGVSCVWVINPRNRRGWIYTSDGMTEAKDGLLRTQNPEITVPLAEIFAPLVE